VLLAFLGATGCAAGTVRDGVYLDGQGRFSVRVPSARWQPIRLDGAVLGFRAPALDAGMALRADCDRPEPGPLPWVARHLFFGLADVRIDASEPPRRADANRVHTRLRARLDGRSVVVDAVTLRSGSCLYDFMYVAPPEHVEDGRPDFDAFVQSWSPGPAR
jgi:hypothetical protein